MGKPLKIRNCSLCSRIPRPANPEKRPSLLQQTPKELCDGGILLKV